MKATSQSEIKKELNSRSKEEILQFVLRLSRFKKENKELLTYLLFESDDEESYIMTVKEQVEQDFTQINISSYYFIKKSVRKILRTVKKYIRYSDQKETEIELMLHFCQCLNDMNPSYKGNIALVNLMRRQIDAIKRNMKKLHEDLQYDFKQQLDQIKI